MAGLFDPRVPIGSESVTPSPKPKVKGRKKRDSAVDRFDEALSASYGAQLDPLTRFSQNAQEPTGDTIVDPMATANPFLAGKPWPTMPEPQRPLYKWEKDKLGLGRYPEKQITDLAEAAYKLKKDPKFLSLPIQKKVKTYVDFVKRNVINQPDFWEGKKGASKLYRDILFAFLAQLLVRSLAQQYNLDREQDPMTLLKRH